MPREGSVIYLKPVKYSGNYSLVFSNGISLGHVFPHMVTYFKEVDGEFQTARSPFFLWAWYIFRFTKEIEKPWWLFTRIWDCEVYQMWLKFCDTILKAHWLLLLKCKAVSYLNLFTYYSLINIRILHSAYDSNVNLYVLIQFETLTAWFIPSLKIS